MNNENNLKNPPLVSIITPSFNSENFIEETILSVLNQSYKNIEYLIIDGGSKDKTIDIIKKYEDKLTYWISEKDEGQSDAINKGFAKSKGKLVTWIGADDVLHENCVEHIVESYLLNDNASIFYGTYQFIDKEGIKGKKISYPNISYKTLITNNPIVAQPGSFYNRKYISEDYFVQNELHYCMDYYVWLKMGQKGKIVYLNKHLAFFRIHSQSKTGTSKIKFIQEQIKISSEFGRKFISPLTFYLYKGLLKQMLIKYKLYPLKSI